MLNESVASETIRFIKRHAWHLLLLVPGSIIVTVLHESAHAAVVLLKGGVLSRFVWIPGDGKWGYVSYSFPLGEPHSRFLISIAPYALWLGLAVFVYAISFRRHSSGYRQASLLYCWLFLVPLADIANTAFPYLAGQQNDFRSAFGDPTPIVVLGIGLAGLSAVLSGYLVQRRLYRDHSLSVLAYLALSTFTVGLLVLLTTGSLLSGWLI